MWRVSRVTGNPGAAATLTSSTSDRPTFTAAADGTYVVQLVASNSDASSVPTQLTIVVNSALPYAPSALRFAGAGPGLNIKDILQAGAAGCTTCHKPGGNGTVMPVQATRTTPPICSGSTPSCTGASTSPTGVASPLLRKPSGHHHGANFPLRGVIPLAGFESGLVPGSAGRADYDKVVSWILNDAPE